MGSRARQERWRRPSAGGAAAAPEGSVEARIVTGPPVPRAPEALLRRRSRTRPRMRRRVRARTASPSHHMSATVGAGAALLAGNALPSLAPLVPSLAAALRIPTRLADPGAVAVTFDDGPHAEGTPSVLGVLDRERVGATFFLAGEQVRRQPGLAAEIVAPGHALQLHCDRHRNQLRLSG